MNKNKVLKDLVERGNVEQFAKMIGFEDDYIEKIIDHRIDVISCKFDISDESELILYFEDGVFIAFEYGYYDYKYTDVNLHYLNYWNNYNNYYRLSNFLRAIDHPVKFNDYDSIDKFMEALEETLQDTDLLEEGE